MDVPGLAPVAFSRAGTSRISTAGRRWGNYSLELRSGWSPRCGRRHEETPVTGEPIPFAGIAFLWFIGVIRDRIGAREDRFFATVFLGSGLLFVGK
jgi:hypothetical protein